MGVNILAISALEPSGWSVCDPMSSCGLFRRCLGVLPSNVVDEGRAGQTKQIGVWALQARRCGKRKAVALREAARRGLPFMYRREGKR